DAPPPRREMPPRSAPPMAQFAPQQMAQFAPPPTAPYIPPPMAAPAPPAGPDFSALERHLLKITSQIESLQRPDHIEQSIAAFRRPSTRRRDRRTALDRLQCRLHRCAGAAFRRRADAVVQGRPDRPVRGQWRRLRHARTTHRSAELDAGGPRAAAGVREFGAY